MTAPAALTRLPVRCCKCTIIYSWADPPATAKQGDESTGYCLVCFKTERRAAMEVIPCRLPA